MSTDPTDVREEIFRSCRNKTICAALVAEAAGIVSGVERAAGLAGELGLDFNAATGDGTPIEAGAEIARVAGDAIRIARAEEVLIGAVSKASGIATRANRALNFAGADLVVVAGGWKKMPHEIKATVRDAVKHGGLQSRISDRPFIYLDKNYVRILGGVEKAVSAVAHLKREIAVQVRGETGPIDAEAVSAAISGASIVMIDTGAREQAEIVHQALVKSGLRDKVRLAFAGNLSVEDLSDGALRNVDIADIGYDIVDAPALPIRFDVIDAG